MNTKSCIECNKIFEKSKNCSKKEWENRMFCSRKCKSKSSVIRNKIRNALSGKSRLKYIGHIVTPETRLKISIANIGRKNTEETKKLISLKTMGRKAWNKGKKCPWVSDRNIISNKLHSGSNHWNWKGNITPTNMEARRRAEYILWRKSCLERDNFTCQKTGQIGGKLEVHHINNFSEFKELRTSLENGITLSKEAHREFHKIYGRKNNTKEQITKFLSLS